MGDSPQYQKSTDALPEAVALAASGQINDAPESITIGGSIQTGDAPDSVDIAGSVQTDAAPGERPILASGVSFVMAGHYVLGAGGSAIIVGDQTGDTIPETISHVAGNFTNEAPETIPL